MILSEEIKGKATEFDISPQNVQRDYVFGWMLSGLFSDQNTKDQLILKGGNALRKGYYKSTRFSKDLDFSVLSSINQIELLNNINGVLKNIHERSGIEFLIDKTDVRPKLVIDNKQVYEAKIVFQGFYEKEEANIKIQMDVTEFDKIILPVQTRSLIHPYSDSASCDTVIKCHKVEEILASKLDSLLRRRRVGDLFDLVFAIIKNQEYQVNRAEVISTFLQRTIYRDNPQVAQVELKGLQIEQESRPFWSTLIAPITSLFGFDDAIREFKNIIDLLFAQISIPTNNAINYASAGFIPGNRRSSYFPGSNSSISYFSSDFRSKIINAGQTLTMLNLLYHNTWRMVEPYALKYTIRQRDNKGLEYFWAFDTSGGNSGRISIKRFISEDIQDVQQTVRKFSPQWPVEL